MAASAAPIQPRFEPTDCWETFPHGVLATCGYVIVPENRGRPAADDDTVRLAVVALRAPGVAYAQPPTILLGGGPGQDVVGLFAGFFRDYAALKTQPYPPEAYPGHWNDLQAFEQVMDLLIADLQKREFIYFDQRGAGYSEPALRCYAEGWDVCRDRLAAAGVDLVAYNTSENADDVNDVRLALGYDQINLQGGSYGTRLALEVMRRHPAIVRAAVLDGVVPPQTYWSTEMVRRYADALQVLFDHCRADLRCNAAYPDLGSVFYRLVARLNARALEVPVGDHQEPHDGDDLRDTVWNALWDAHTIPFVPMLIAQVEAGNPDIWGKLLTAAGQAQDRASQDTIAWGMHYSVECAERTAFETHQGLVAAAQALPPVIRAGVVAAFDDVFWICEQWDVPTAPALVHTPVRSEIPTLLLSGEFDPGTQPAFAALAAETLTHHFSYVFPYRGHTDGFTNPCQSTITSAFLDDPGRAPDTSCIAAMDVAPFAVPDDANRLSR